MQPAKRLACIARALERACEQRRAARLRERQARDISLQPIGDVARAAQFTGRM
jgi:hypothetical protein